MHVGFGGDDAITALPQASRSPREICHLNPKTAVEAIARMDGVTNFQYSDVPIWRCRGEAKLEAVVPSREDVLRVTYCPRTRYGLAAKVQLPEGMILGEFVGAVRHPTWCNQTGQRNRATGNQDIRAMNVVAHGKTTVHHVLDMQSVANFSVLLNHDHISPNVGAIRLDELGTRLGVVLLKRVLPGVALTMDYGRLCSRALRLWGGGGGQGCSIHL